MKGPTAKKLQLTKETLRTLSTADLRAVIGGTDVTPSDVEANCIEIGPVSDSCVASADGCVIDVNSNTVIGGVNTVRRF